MTLALYVPRGTVVHRTPAGWKLLALAGLSVLVFAVPTLPVVCGALGAVVVVGLVVARLPAAVLLRQTRAVRWMLVAIFILHAVLTDVLTGTLTVLRLLALVLAAAVVTATTRVTAMVAVVERICRPLEWVGVRPARIGLVIAMALRFIPLIAERADRIRDAQAARGGSVRGLRGLRTTVVPLLVQVLQLAHTVSEALDARGADDVPLRRRDPRAT
ncbi:energy-coupling factor transporter transmembrane protein EcfT [Blastococcus sp. CT_GayMR19]|uniref:energy-coupling factor transporter transmembrane component T family protein n=1 Tax=Blastococcus sp. CT_GayMR19 TaxID=2559608 RepID=UPI00107493E0|nr:energy-coupling factor transporter transmembrane protein EcfT [Blastococcus sp. CT_GayMR19]TFV71082.1 energy-coupling factor transporter transmembrane protein EcfT [Blastococcus sp. CT_GayMR19]